MQPSGSSRELLGQCLPHPQYYEAGTPFFAGLPDSVVATVQDDKAISSSVWTVSGLWQIAVCALQPHPSPILLLPNGGGIYGFWFICCLLLCLGLNLRRGLTILAELRGGKGSIPAVCQGFQNSHLFPPFHSWFCQWPEKSCCWPRMVQEETNHTSQIAITDVRWEAKLRMAQWSPGYLHCVLEEKRAHKHSQLMAVSCRRE